MCRNIWKTFVADPPDRSIHKQSRKFPAGIRYPGMRGWLYQVYSFWHCRLLQVAFTTASVPISVVSTVGLPALQMWQNPCKIRTEILAGSRRDLGGNPVGISARFWPPGFFFPAGISPGSRQDSRRETKFQAAKFSPGSCRESRQDSRREAKIPAAKISPGSCRESRQDSRREAKIPAAKIWPECYRESRQDSRRGANSLWQKSRRDLAGNLAKIGDGKRNSWWDSLRESPQNFSHAATNFF